MEIEPPLNAWLLAIFAAFELGRIQRIGQKRGTTEYELVLGKRREAKIYRSRYPVVTRRKIRVPPGPVKEALAELIACETG
jgi:hypothetical protein